MPRPRSGKRLTGHPALMERLTGHPALMAQLLTSDYAWVKH